MSKTYQINLIVQGMLASLSLLALIAGLVNFRNLFFLVFLQIPIGFTQYCSGWLFHFKYRNNRSIKNYLWIASSNLILVIITILLTYITESDLLYLTTFFIFPWAIAIYYWCISFKYLFRSLFRFSFFK